MRTPLNMDESLERVIDSTILEIYRGDGSEIYIRTSNGTIAIEATIENEGDTDELPDDYYSYSTYKFFPSETYESHPMSFESHLRIASRRRKEGWTTTRSNNIVTSWRVVSGSVVSGSSSSIETDLRSAGWINA